MIGPATQSPLSQPHGPLSSSQFAQFLTTQLPPSLAPTLLLFSTSLLSCFQASISAALGAVCEKVGKSFLYRENSPSGGLGQRRN